jgi:tetratricopeptide (TPR) repeat protein
MDRIKNSRLTLLLGLLLAAATLATFWPVIHHDFVNCDDQAYVYENPALQAGLNWQGIAWAFTTDCAGNWHPLTWLSHLLDVQCFGLNAGWHHLTSLLLHVANTLLLFVVLKRMTGALWRSAVVAALFALHPLHVESVAWIAERKDVLSGLFFMLTLWAYGRYVEVQSPRSKVQGLKSETRNPKAEGNPKSEGRRPKPDSESTAGCGVPSSRFEVQRSMFDVRPFPASSNFHPPSSVFYLLAMCFFALGLMSKPMLVTLPFLLLLLDYWPLRRLNLPWCEGRGARGNVPSSQPSILAPPTPPAPQPGALGETRPTYPLHPTSTPTLRLLLEKLPFFALAAASSIVTFLVQRRAGAVAAVTALPLGLRLENALVSCLLYLAKTVWPARLAVFYPYRHHVSEDLLVLSAVVLLAISALAWFSLRTRPYLAVGWLWFLGMLVPVIGIVQVGTQSMADRYTYLPLIGIFMVVVWAAADLATRRSMSSVQSSTFDVHRSMFAVPSLSLATIALSLAAAVVLAACLVLTRAQVRHWRNSETLFRHALAVTTDNALAHHSLGAALAKQHRLDEAEPHFVEAVRLWPKYPQALNDLALMRVVRGKAEEGVALFRAALASRPSDWKTHNNLARTLCQQGKFDEGIKEYQTALKLNPGATDTRGFLAAALVERGRPQEAMGVFEDALKLRPQDAEAHFKYASLLMALGQTEAAALHFRAALQYEPRGAETHRRYGVLLAGGGKTREAIEQFREAIRFGAGAEAHYNLATALIQQGQPAEAVPEYRESLRLNPDLPAALNDFAWLLAASASDRLRHGAEAVTLAERACQLTQYREPLLVGTLAAAYAEAGRFADAVQTAEKAIAVATAAGQKVVADKNRQLIELYRAGQPYHEPRQ